MNKNVKKEPNLNRHKNLCHIANFDRIVTYSVPIVHYFKRVFFFWYWRSVPFSSYYEKLLSKDHDAFSLMQDVELSRDLNKPNRRYYFKPGFFFSRKLQARTLINVKSILNCVKWHVNSKIHVLLFDYDNEHQKKYTKFHHTEGFTYHKSSFISLQVNTTNLENAHVNKPSCFGHWI